MTYRTAIDQTASELLPLIEKGQTPSDLLRKSMTVYRKSLVTDIVQKTSVQFTLSWSHYVFLMGDNDIQERSFYEIEATSQDWSLRDVMVEGEDFDKAVSIAIKWAAANKNSRPYEKIKLHQGVMSAPEFDEYEIIDSARVWNLPF